MFRVHLEPALARGLQPGFPRPVSTSLCKFFNCNHIVAYELDASSDETFVNILGPLDKGQDWAAAFGEHEDDPGGFC